MISTIQIQTIDACNAKCIMCPRKHIFQTKESMDITKFQTLVLDMKEAIKKGFISKKPKVILNFENEPLCDVFLFDKIKYLKSHIDCYVIIYTNGALVPSYITKLEESEIDEIVLSHYGDSLDAFNTVTQMGMSYEYFYHMKRVIEKLNQVKYVRVWEAWRDGKLYDFSTRAGLTKKATLNAHVHGCSWNRPYHWLHIHSNGDLVLCCQDWKRETKFGNAFEQSLIKTLKSKRYKDMMQKATGLKESDANFICKRCKYNK